jgi:hypothetical protein
MRVVLWMASATTALLLSATARADGDGLLTDAGRVPWAHFEARIGYGFGAPVWRASLAPLQRSGLQIGGLRLLGDMYLFGSKETPSAPTSGFRATSGIIVGARSPWLGSGATPSSPLFGADRRLFGAGAPAPTSAADGGTDTSTVPYIGIGYSSLSAKSGWSFSADLGVVSQSPGNVARFGRLLGGSQSLDDVVRDMRLAPVVQLGVSYSF